MEKKHTTIKDIAKQLNLHHTTVSKALRNHPDINKNTRELIQSTALEMDYHPNLMARSFKSRKSNIIGICVPVINVDFFSDVISGIQNVVYDADYTIMVCQSNETYERELVDTSALISNQVSGLIISISQTTTNSDHLKVFQRREIPLVLFDRTLDDIEANKVIIDDFAGAFLIVEHLIKSGYKRIAHFTGPLNISNSRDRFNGYKAALHKYGIPVDEKFIIHGGFDENSGIICFQKLQQLAQLPDAIFTVNDPVASGLYLIIKENGLKIPDDIAVAGYGDIKISSFLDPPMTTIRQYPYQVGTIAANMILDQINSSSTHANPKVEILKPELVIRKST